MRASLPLLLLAVACAGTETGDAAPADAFARVSCALTVPADHPTVQAAVDAAADGDTICIRAGTWTGPVLITSRELALVGEGPRTIVSGGGAGTVLTLTSATVDLAGMQIVDGFSATGGGGIEANQSHVTIERVRITDNTGEGGGGLSASQSDVSLTRTKILRNTSTGSGGGISSGETLIWGHDLVVADNVAHGSGGGIYTGRSGLDLVDSVVADNEAGGNGGGIHAYNGGVDLANVLVARNHADGLGGGLDVGGYVPDYFENVVVVGNDAQNGGAMHVGGWGYYPVIVNSVIAWNEGIDGVGGFLVDTYGTLDISYSDLWANAGDLVDPGQPDPVGVDGNVAVEPEFVSMAGSRWKRWDLHLQAGSPLIDAGDPALSDPDGTRSDVGLYGGPLAD